MNAIYCREFWDCLSETNNQKLSNVDNSSFSWRNERLGRRRTRIFTGSKRVNGVSVCFWSNKFEKNARFDVPVRKQTQLNFRWNYCVNNYPAWLPQVLNASHSTGKSITAVAHFVVFPEKCPYSPTESKSGFLRARHSKWNSCTNAFFPGTQ